MVGITSTSIKTKFKIITALTVVLSFISLMSSIELSKMTAMQKIERDHMTYALALRAKTEKFFQLLANNKTKEASIILSKKSNNFKQMGVVQLIDKVKAQPEKVYKITMSIERGMFTMIGFGNAFELADKGLVDSKKFKKIIQQIQKDITNYKKYKKELLMALDEIEDNGIRFAPIVTEASNFVSNMMLVMIFFGIIALISFLYLIGANITNNISIFQNGLIDFFDFLSGKRSDTKTIIIDTKDELQDMAKIINQHMDSTKDKLAEDYELINEVKSMVEKVKLGILHDKIDSSTQNESLNELKIAFNEMLDVMSDKICTDITKLQDALKGYQELDFRYRIPNAKGKTASGLNHLADMINEMLVENKNSGNTLDKNSNMLLENVKILASSTHEASSSLEQTTSALNSIESNISQTNQNITKMATFANGLSSSASEGKNLAGETVEAMMDIDKEVNSISDAIGIIDQIAFQTNILSLNAAVEAATAGESGKGFAVVAGEVRNLASRSAESANDIKGIVEKATSKTNSGKAIANQMIEGYEKLNEDITQTTMLIADIEHSSKEQLENIQKINEAASHLDSQTNQISKIALKTEQIAIDTHDVAKIIMDDVNKKEFIGKD